MALTPAPDHLQHRQACLKALYYRHPTTALAIPCTSPAARHCPLPEHVLIEHRGIEPAMPDEAQFRGVGKGEGNGVFGVDHGP